jgi:hypothetical protein
VTPKDISSGPLAVGGQCDEDGDVPPLAARAAEWSVRPARPLRSVAHAMREGESEARQDVSGLEVEQLLDAPRGRQAEGEQVERVEDPNSITRTHERLPY